MKRFIAALVILLMGITSPSLAQDCCGPRLVAFSFDDAPWPDTTIMSGEERTRRIIDALRSGGAEQAIFFAVSSRIDGETISRVHAYANAGHLVASHSHTHPNLHRIGSDAFLRDVEIADDILSEIPGFAAFFRFPYLNEGETVEQRDAVRSRLGELGYRPGYVTIDTFDFYIDRLLRDAVGADAEIDYEAVGNLYVEMIVGAAEHYDAVARRWLGRSPHHILLLHENDAAALFLPKLISTLKEEGWEIVSATAAYKDPIADTVPDTLFLGQGQVAALAALAGARESELRHKGEDTDVLRSAFRKLLSGRVE